MDLALIIKSLEVITDLRQMISNAVQAANRDPEGKHCRIQQSTIDNWKETVVALERFTQQYKAQALEWKFETEYLAAKEAEKQRAEHGVVS